jgi:methylated-DNA-[protein]-cysteine S-methyltransferase
MERSPSALKTPTQCGQLVQPTEKNPISIIVPCHRVIGASGKLTGFAGGLEIKA